MMIMVDGRIWSDLLSYIRQSAGYLQTHARESTRLINALYSVVCLILTRSSGIFNSAIESTFALGGHICLRLLYLAIIILLVCLCKSLSPRYKFLNGRACSYGQSARSPFGCRFHETQANTEFPTSSNKLTSNKSVAFKEVVRRFLMAVERRWRIASKTCADSLTDGNIQSIYKQLSWSSTRPEFESVYWFNHTIQTMWPTGRTLMHNFIVDAIAKSKNIAKKQTTKRGRKQKSKQEGQIKLKMIKVGDKRKRAIKLSDFISCRRQLEILHKNKGRVLSRNDEHIVGKSIFMLVYLFKKFILYFKQYLMDQLYWLIVNLSPDETRPTDYAEGGRLIELDWNDLMSGRKIKFKLDKRKTKSAGEPIDTSGGLRAGRIRFRSAPEPGLAFNSRRAVGIGRLISYDGIKSLRNKRQKLIRSVNEMVRDSRNETGVERSRNRRRITVEALELGEKAPEITAVKFLEKDDDVLAETLIGGRPISSSACTNTMHLIIELSFESGKQFQICLSSVPLLNRLRLTKLDVRLRLLVAINHVNFDNQDNLVIRRALNSNQLLPIFNQIQVALVDRPQLNWCIRRARSDHVGLPRFANRAIRRKPNLIGSRNIHISNLVKSPIVTVSRHLELFHFINTNYFKYLVHCSLYWLQVWFQPFDILIGDKLFIKTLW